MASYTNERGQIVYADNPDDIGIARPQGESANTTTTTTSSAAHHSAHHGAHHEKHGVMQDIKETVKDGVNTVAEGMSKLADKITNNPEHDHLSSKVQVIKEQ